MGVNNQNQILTSNWKVTDGHGQSRQDTHKTLVSWQSHNKNVVLQDYYDHYWVILI